MAKNGLFFDMSLSTWKCFLGQEFAAPEKNSSNSKWEKLETRQTEATFRLRLNKSYPLDGLYVWELELNLHHPVLLSWASSKDIETARLLGSFMFFHVLSICGISWKFSASEAESHTWAKIPPGAIRLATWKWFKTLENNRCTWLHGEWLGVPYLVLHNFGSGCILLTVKHTEILLRWDRYWSMINMDRRFNSIHLPSFWTFSVSLSGFACSFSLRGSLGQIEQLETLQKVSVFMFYQSFLHKATKCYK